MDRIEIKIEPGLQFDKPLRRRMQPQMITRKSSAAKKIIKEEYLEPVSILFFPLVQ